MAPVQCSVWLSRIRRPQQEEIEAATRVDTGLLHDRLKRFNLRIRHRSRTVVSDETENFSVVLQHP